MVASPSSVSHTNESGGEINCCVFWKQRLRERDGNAIVQGCTLEAAHIAYGFIFEYWVTPHMYAAIATFASTSNIMNMYARLTLLYSVPS